MRFHFILINPKLPENLGFVCRALKTMGFHSLRLVNASRLHIEKGAQNTAYQAHDILNDITFYNHFEASVQDLDLIIGTTAKTRTGRKSPLSPKSLKKILHSKASIIRNAGIVFGSEEDGLPNEILAQCDILSSIPMKTTYPSINLSHSVMIYAYELSEAEHSPLNEPPATSADKENEQYALKTQTRQFLQWLKVDRQPVLYQRLLDRLMLLNASDTRLLLALFRYLRNISNIKKPSGKG